MPNGPARGGSSAPGTPALAALSWVVLTSTWEPQMLVAAVDSSTQSTKVLLCQADDGTIVGEATAPHPDGTECDPELWWQALAQAGDGLLDQADAIGVAAQQHGMVVVDEVGQVLRTGLL